MTLLSAGIITDEVVTTTTIDSYERTSPFDEYGGNTDEWDRVDPSTLAAAWTAPDGTYVARNLAGQGFSRIISKSGSGLPSYFPKGNIARCHVRTTALEGELRALFGVAASSSFGNYYVAEIDYGNGAVRIEKLVDDGTGAVRTELNSNTTISPSANTTGYLEITWDDGTLGGADNDITVAYIEGGTELGSVTTNDPDHATEEGVGLNGHNNSTADFFADWYHIRSTQ